MEGIGPFVNVTLDNFIDATDGGTKLFDRDRMQWVDIGEWYKCGQEYEGLVDSKKTTEKI